jgi:hypothetical protein
LLNKAASLSYPYSASCNKNKKEGDMALLGLSESTHDALAGKNFKQIVAISGDGNLKDGSPCSEELREYLTTIEAEKLYQHAEFCLTSPFENSGYALQDLVNELGRRLGFEVENGRYQGNRSEVGNDGLWLSKDQQVIVEVKTTDAYRFNLNTLAGYKSKLRDEGELSGDASILIVVGRDDTGDLEDQIRGSRYAWDIRIISVRALCDLVTLNIRSDEIATADKIRAVLKPIEYTRVDRLIDVMLTAVNDVDTVDEAGGAAEVLVDEPKGDEIDEQQCVQEHTPQEVQAEARREAVSKLSDSLGKPLLQSRRTDFLSSDKKTLAVCLYSKVYGETGEGGLWFGINPNQFQKLEKYEQGFFLFCSEAQISLAVPVNVLSELKSRMNATENESHFHWHVHIEFSEGRYDLVLRNGEKVDISEYLLPVKA